VPKSQSISYSASSNPFADIQLLTSTASLLSFGDDREINGKKYWTVVATLNQANIKALLGSVLDVAEQEIEDAAGGSTAQGQLKGIISRNVTGKVEAAGSLTYYIDPKTLITEIANYEASEVTTINSGTNTSSVTIFLKGDISLHNLNQAVNFLMFQMLFKQDYKDLSKKDTLQYLFCDCCLIVQQADYY